MSKKEKVEKDMLQDAESEKAYYPEHGKPMRIRTYWRKLMNSTQKRMSRGSAQIARMISWARGENWRRGGEGNRQKKK